jgi:hypothetical protein
MNQGFSAQLLGRDPSATSANFAAEPFFNGLCGQCHSAISGKAVDVAVNPDMLSQASNVVANGAPSTNVAIGPSTSGPFVGPPTSP